MLVTMMSIVGAFVSPPATLMWRTMQSRATWTGRPAVHSTDTPKCDVSYCVCLDWLYDFGTSGAVITRGRWENVANVYWKQLTLLPR